jgi:4-hydroxy-3-methylbut-2-enyl diphosphate reductase
MKGANVETMELPEAAPVWLVMVFDRNNRLLLAEADACLGPLAAGEGTGDAEAIAGKLPFAVSGLRRAYDCGGLVVWFALLAEDGGDGSYLRYTLNALSQTQQQPLAPSLKTALAAIEPYIVEIPYLDLSENDYIYRFRTHRERNRDVYLDRRSEALYQSALCEAIKTLRRVKEKASGEPVELDFGPVRYILPSHFGFCLGVQNAIERAYEAVAENPGKRVFMLSELIHNPYVNEDLKARGLRYLQSDKGVPLDAGGKPVASREDPAALWTQLTEDDAVIIPAFGATNEDKVALIRRGIAVRIYDATCMLVEKVWKAARRYAREGYTVIIHGKAEHEETKATFSNSSRWGPALIVRNMEHARVLGDLLLDESDAMPERFELAFKGCYSAGFDPQRDLERIAVVNQTTLLRNETLGIIDYLRKILAIKYGEDAVEAHMWSQGKGDTLCYATQVNQDALEKAVIGEVDAALVVGGKNSSNTFQLFRVCEKHFGERAHYIQSEENLLSRETVRHYVFPYATHRETSGHYEERRLLPLESERPLRVLITGGASCPDGIIQQVICRMNGFFPGGSLRSIDAVIADIEANG